MSLDKHEIGKRKTKMIMLSCLLRFKTKETIILLSTTFHLFSVGLPTQLPPGAIPIHVPNGQAPVGQFLMTPNGLVQLQPMIAGPTKVVSNLAVKMNEQEPFKSVLDLPDDVDVMEGNTLPRTKICSISKDDRLQ